MVLFSLLAIIVSLLLVVGIHEGGHAWVAHIFKVKITTVSIGFGKPLFSWKGKHCQWVWALWPFGGYVKLLNSRIEPVALKDRKFSFDKKPVWVRCLILLAGAGANILMAWLALMLMLIIGYQQMVPVITKVTSTSIAAKAGLEAGDQIISLGGQSAPSWREVGMQFIMTLGQPEVRMVVQNPAGVKRQVTLDLSHWPYKQQVRQSFLQAMGITPDLSKKNIQKVAGLSLLKSGQNAFKQMTDLLYFFIIMLKQLLTGMVPFTVLLGPLGLFTAIISSFLQGLAVFLYFIASFSLAVALINILPLPGLDGGSIVYALVEKIRGTPVSVGMEILLHRLMFIIFCMVLVQLVLNDLQRFFH